MAELLYRIGRFAVTRRLTVVVTWLALLAVTAGTFVAFGTAPTAPISIPGTPTAVVTDRLAEAIPGAAGLNGTVAFRTTDGSPFSDEQKAAIAEAAARATELDDVTLVVDPFVTQAETEAQAQQLAAGRTQLEAAQQLLELGQDQADGGLFEGLAATLAENTLQLEAGEALLELSSELRLVSEDGDAAQAAVIFTMSQAPLPEETADEVMAAFTMPAIEGVQVEFSSTIASGIPDILGVGELIGVAIAGVVLFVMLGTLIGAGLPIVTAAIGVGIATLGALSFAEVVEMLSVTPVLGVMLGLAVGIDYSLFIINRHRHQLMDGYTVAESIPLANGTSGNAVFFAGSTVFIALLALNLTGIGFLGLMGTVGAVAVAIAVFVAITLTPALLSYVDLRVLRQREREHLAEREGPAARKPVKELSAGRALGIALVGISALLVLAVPAADLRLGLPLGDAEPADSTQHRAYDLIEAEFGAGANGPLVVVAELPAPAAEEELLGRQAAVAQRLAEFSDVVAVAPAGTSEDGAVLAFQVLPAEGPASVSTEDLVRSLREASPLEGGITIGVAGQTSGNIDISETLADALPVYLLVVIGLSLLIMIVVFRSLYVPLVATGGFVVSYFAALGVVVAIYQWGWLGDLFGVTSPGPILNFLPTALAGILFGLAMDYTLFLATGMREAYVHGAPARTAVILGVRAGRTVVIAAALIMASVFGSFILAESVFIRPIALALALGVLVDAFIVRLIIMPAVISLAGDGAWWIPRWLDRILPNVDVEGAVLERRHPHVAPDHREPGPSEAEAPATGG